MLADVTVNAPVLEAPSEVEYVDPAVLKPHPKNPELYGADEPVPDLVQRIVQSGWVRPLLVSTRTGDPVVVQGHRRLRAVLQLGLQHIPIERRDYASEADELRDLLLDNVYRDKTREQKVREARAWKTLEAEKARQRQRDLAGFRHKRQAELLVPKRSAPETSGQNLPEGSGRRTRDAVAAYVGLGSGRTYDKAERVVSEADALLARGDTAEADTLLKLLNADSVDAAYQIVKLDDALRTAALTKLASRAAKTTKDAIRLARREQRAASEYSSAVPVAGDQPDHTRPTGILYRGDCLDILPTLPADSVQLVVTSPPYNVAWDYGDGGIRDRRPLAEYLDFLQAALEGCYRVLRSGGVLALNLPSTIRTPEHRAYPMAAWAQWYLLSGGWLLREPIVWMKSKTADGETPYSTSTAIGGPRDPHLRPCYELILVASRGEYSLPGKDSKRWPGDDRQWGQYLDWCKDVWGLPPGRAVRGEPLAFPAALVGRLVALYSEPGDVVLDPFAGSGTVGRIAIAECRQSRLIEREPTYWTYCEAALSAPGENSDGACDESEVCKTATA